MITSKRKYEYQEPTGFERLFNSYLSFKSCRNLFKLEKRYSTADYLIKSGSSTVIVEHKSSSKNIYEYSFALLEQTKLDGLKKFQKYVDGSPILYCLEFIDCILIYELDHLQLPPLTVITTQADNVNKQQTDKQVYFLPFTSATWIIGKGIANGSKFYSRASAEQLNKYTSLKNQ